MTDFTHTPHHGHADGRVSEKDMSLSEFENAIARDKHLLAMLSVSSGMVGACLTAISLIGIVKTLNKIETIVDDMLAMGTLVFTIAAALSFIGMRTHVGRRWRHVARWIDGIFFLGLVMIVAAAGFLTWVVI